MSRFRSAAGVLAAMAAILCLGQAAPTQPAAPQSDSTGEKEYVCMPCGSPCDQTVHHVAGRCPDCGMLLVEKPKLTVAIVISNGVELLDFAGPAEVFSQARYGGGPAFTVLTVASSRDPIVSQGFVTITPTYSFADCPKPTILIVPGGGDGRSDELIRFVNKSSKTADLTLSVCTGAFTLARAGLLVDLEATTWHGAIESLRREAPRTTVHADRRFVDNGDVITAAGVSAGIDASLYVVRRMFGPDEAQRIADYMEYRWTPDEFINPGRVSRPKTSSP